MPATFELLEENRGLITIKEGKYHQVKRMMQALNMEVLTLKRIEFGPLKLPNDLKLGEYRELTAEELELLKK
jgi:16S rRNA pseudouridine516 synthase